LQSVLNFRRRTGRMNFMHFRGLDLNLLTAFNALMRHRNVTRAAEDVRITQSALSHALVRLRSHYGDPLFVRAKGVMNPTPRALNIADPIAEALQKISGTFRNEFDHTHLNRAFRVGLVDFAAAFLLPALTERISADAPHAQITAEHMTFAAAKRQLGTPEMDFVIGVCPSTPPSCLRELLFTERFSVIARQTHPDIGRKLTLAKYAALRHVEVPIYRGIESVLRKHGIVRKFSVKAENLLTVPFIVARSSLIATVPKGFAHVFSHSCKLRVFDPPFGIEPYNIQLLWHRRSDADPAHAWLAGIIRSIALDMRRDFRVAMGSA
jgi:DNA-binding transcriptional LysR family regulator